MRILLACAGGMSTSLIVTKMEKVAATKGIDCVIWATSEGGIQRNLGKFDVLLIGPQIRFAQNKIKDLLGEDFPMEVIRMADYGLCDGEAIFNRAVELYNEAYQLG